MANIKKTSTTESVNKTTDGVHEFFLMLSQSASIFESSLQNYDPNISPTQWSILVALKESSLRPIQVARKQFQSRQAIQRASRKLLKEGLITSSTSEGEKAVTLAITPKGLTLVENINNGFQATVESLNEKTPGLKLDNTTKMLKRVARALKPEEKQTESKAAKS